MYEYEGSSDPTCESPEALSGEEVEARAHRLFAPAGYQPVPSNIAAWAFSLGKPALEVCKLFVEMLHHCTVDRVGYKVIFFL